MDAAGAGASDPPLQRGRETAFERRSAGRVAFTPSGLKREVEAIREKQRRRRQRQAGEPQACGPVCGSVRTTSLRGPASRARRTILVRKCLATTTGFRVLGSLALLRC